MATLTKKQIAELEKSHTLCVVFRDGTAQTWKHAGMLSNFRKLDIIRMARGISTECLNGTFQLVKD